MNCLNDIKHKYESFFMINKTELKDVVLRFQSKTDISIKDIFGEDLNKSSIKATVSQIHKEHKVKKI